MEIGSFLELDFRDTGELFDGSEDCRLNLNRAVFIIVVDF